MNSDSVLETVRKIVGPSCSYDAFDPELIVHTNSVFMAMSQIGIGPEVPFHIEDENDEWGDFSDNIMLIEAVKSYVPLRVRMIFDPPTNSGVASAIEKTITELEWRLQLICDGGNNNV